MTDEAKALLATVEDMRRKAIDTRDRAHKLSETLRGAATRIRMGYDPQVELRALRRRGVSIGEREPEVAGA